MEWIKVSELTFRTLFFVMDSTANTWSPMDDSSIPAQNKLSPFQARVEGGTSEKKPEQRGREIMFVRATKTPPMPLDVRVASRKVLS